MYFGMVSAVCARARASSTVERMAATPDLCNEVERSEAMKRGKLIGGMEERLDGE